MNLYAPSNQHVTPHTKHLKVALFAIFTVFVFVMNIQHLLELKVTAALTSFAVNPESDVSINANTLAVVTRLDSYDTSNTLRGIFASPSTKQKSCLGSGWRRLFSKKYFGAKGALKLALILLR